MSEPVVVHLWPDSAQLALAALRSRRAITAIGIVLADTTPRDVARAQMRHALRTTLAVWLQCPLESVSLHSHPGTALRLDFPEAKIGLSISHETGLSVAAIALDTATGIDVMRIGQGEDWMPDWENVAHAYLGPLAYRRIAQVEPPQRPAAFAREWTRFEACLKCLGMDLTEWTPQLARTSATCRTSALTLPPGYCGTIAVM